jgi:hypothetical protein
MIVDYGSEGGTESINDLSGGGNSTNDSSDKQEQEDWVA